MEIFSEAAYEEYRKEETIMDKPTVNMTNWELYVYEDRYSLSGTADFHPVLGKNAYISRTSAFSRCEFQDDVLRYETRNTVYVCPLKYMTLFPYVNVVREYKRELSRRAEHSEDPLDKIIAASAKLSLGHDQADDSEDEFLAKVKALQEIGREELKTSSEEEDRRLMNCAMQYEDCIYLEVTKSPENMKLAWHLDGQVGVVLPMIHTGMYQDSVLYMDEALDFRYFPRGWVHENERMETYSWSDNIRCAVIKNETGDRISFNGEDLAADEVKVFFRTAQTMA